MDLANAWQHYDGGSRIAQTDYRDIAGYLKDVVTTSNGHKGTFAGDWNLTGAFDVLRGAFLLVGNLGRSHD